MTVIDLSRNFGHQIAITAGLDYVKGDAVITMDSDLQDPPEVCVQMLKQWENGYEVVYAKRKSRHGDSIFKRFAAKVFYALLDRLSDTPIPRDVGDFRLMDKKVVKELAKFHEHQRFLRGLVGYIGFKQTAVLFDRGSRQKGKTNYSVKKMWNLAVDGITGFSTTPIVLISRLGYLVSSLSVLGILYALGVKFFNPNRTVAGWTFIVVSIFFIGGVQLIMLGLLGSYIARTYKETQNRPLYIVSSIHRKTLDSED